MTENAEVFEHIFFTQGADASEVTLESIRDHLAGNTSIRVDTEDSLRKCCWLAVTTPSLSTNGQLDREKIRKVIDNLASQAISAYVSPTEGAAFYIFFRRLLPQKQLAVYTETVRKFIAEVTGTGSDLLHSPENAVMLPYFEADKNSGAGNFSLLDPRSLEPVSLTRLPSLLEVTEPQSIERLGDLVGETMLSLQPREFPETNEPVSKTEYLWKRELDRVSTKWSQGRRQNLAMGLAGYASYLGLPIQRVLDNVQELALTAGDTEIDTRLTAVFSTFRKADQGEPVAFRCWYEKADMDPPTINGPSHVVLSAVETLHEKSKQKAWQGRTGKSDLAVYHAFLERARKFGLQRPDGVEVTISVRELAEGANLNKDTVTKALDRLYKERDLLYRVDGGGRFQGKKSSSYILKVTEFGHLDNNYLIDKCPSYVTKARDGKGKLGKAPARALDVLAALGGKATKAEWSSALGYEKTKRSYRVRKKLTEAGLVVENDGMCEIVPDVEARFERLMRKDGSVHAMQEAKKRHEVERQRWGQKLRNRGYGMS